MTTKVSSGIELRSQVDSFHSERFHFRTAGFLTFFAGYMYQNQLDAATEQLYRFLLTQWWFRLDTWEPILSTMSFVVFLMFWGAIDLHIPWFRRYRIQKSDDISHWDVSGNFIFVIFIYLAPLAAFDSIYPRRSEKLSVEPISFWWMVTEVVAALVMYDLLFFLSHVALHKVPFLYRAVHKRHHRKAVQRAIETVALTVSDEACDVACSIAALNLLKCHPLSRSIYDVVIIFLLTELHSGYDFPWSLQNVVPFGIFGGSRRHTQHHVDGRVYYQKFFVYLDNAFGFVEKDKTI